MDDLEKIKQRIRDNLLVAHKDKYHKRSNLLGIAVELESMMNLNISIPEMVSVLIASGVVVSAASLRTFFNSRFHLEYQDYLQRNGWYRKSVGKTIKKNNEAVESSTAPVRVTPAIGIQSESPAANVAEVTGKRVAPPTLAEMKEASDSFEIDPTQFDD